MKANDKKERLLGMWNDKSLFPLGQIVTTSNLLNKGGIDLLELTDALMRHMRGDWGDVCDEDKQANDSALKNGGRILSAYTARNGTRFWVITEADRSATTFLLPEDY